MSPAKSFFGALHYCVRDLSYCSLLSTLGVARAYRYVSSGISDS